MYVLDTDILIDIQRGHEPAVRWFAGLREMPTVPFLVVMELIQDAENSRKIRSTLDLVEPLPVAWLTEADCERALADFSALHGSHGLGLLDALIAACAIGLSATLCTFNRKHFRAVPRLVLEQPYVR